MKEDRVNSKRVLAALVDFLLTAVIQFILVVVFAMLPLMSGNLDSSAMVIRMVFLTYCSVSYLVFRDFIFKRSIGKRIFKLTIYHSGTTNEASSKQKLLRNIFWLLGPVEIVLFLIKGKTLGDTLSKTEVITQ